MKQKNKLVLLLLVVVLTSSFIGKNENTNKETQNNTKHFQVNTPLIFEDEKHFKSIRQVTFGGNNAEAYWSFDNKQLVFQSDYAPIGANGCDQIFIINPFLDSLRPVMISSGTGRTTCSYFMPDGSIVYASTHEHGAECPTFTPPEKNKYVWPLFDSYNIYHLGKYGTPAAPLIASKHYDAEATVSPDGKYIIFTSTRSGDLDLWRYEIKTKKLKQLTKDLGYDGGAFFSRDSKKIVWRASRPKAQDAIDYKDLLKKGFVQPKELQVFVADIDGKNVQQVTNLPGANWAPFFHPSGKKVLFCSNHETLKEGGRGFSIFMCNIDGSGLEKITHSNTFDAFPMFSYDGKYLSFSSNRNAERKPSRETNVFVVEWVD
ncbi:MAG: PD40 domain-containing protein [Candidatus Kapabacteria bacterium]|nr:PD40 domain-containing protein [Candidatus Kapabacteria bacterium]